MLHRNVGRSRAVPRQQVNAPRRTTYPTRDGLCIPDGVREEPMVNTTLRDAFDRWKGALIDQDKQTTKAARHRAHARVTSMEDLIAETPANDIEGVGIKLALYVYMSGADPEKADSAVEQVLSAYKDCVCVLGCDLLAEVKSLMPASQQSV